MLILLVFFHFDSNFGGDFAGGGGGTAKKKLLNAHKYQVECTGIFSVQSNDRTANKMHLC